MHQIVSVMVICYILYTSVTKAARNPTNESQFDFHLGISLIHDESNGNPLGYWELLRDNFRNTYKSLTNNELMFTIWPPVFTKGCPSQFNHHTEWRIDKDRGLAMAHTQIWMEFYKQTRIARLNEGLNYKRHYHLIFENDAFPVKEDHVVRVLKELSVMTTEDVNYIGRCGPLCLHAYVISDDGVERLLDLYDNCGIGLDEQMKSWRHSDAIKIVFMKHKDNTDVKNLSEDNEVSVLNDAVKQLGSGYDCFDSLWTGGLYRQGRCEKYHKGVSSYCVGKENTCGIH